MSEPERFTRPPIETYEEALGFLFRRSSVEEWVDGGTLPPEAQLVCDIYWVTEKQLRRDLSRQLRAVLRPVNPLPSYKQVAPWRHG